MFRGSSTLALDAKGRIAIPTKYRAKLLSCCEGELVVTKHPQGCLLIYPLPTWEIAEANIVKLSSVNKNAIGLKRVLVGNAEECAMDAQGRVLLPVQLREFAGLDKKATLLGQVDKFELWNEQSWDIYQDNFIKENATLPDGFADDIGDIAF